MKKYALQNLNNYILIKEFDVIDDIDVATRFAEYNGPNTIAYSTARNYGPDNRYQINGVRLSCALINSKYLMLKNQDITIDNETVTIDNLFVLNGENATFETVLEYLYQQTGTPTARPM
jgi:hypothetical protein